MKPDIFILLLRSLLFYRKTSVYQAVIVFILAAIITGSLLTGYSVRESLKSSANEHLGNTDLLISSGLRYFDTALAGKISLTTGEKCVSVLETSGYCQNFATGVTVLNTKIYGITQGFFSFHRNDSIRISPGSVAINQNLAQHLGINEGDEIIVHSIVVTPIPANAPFAHSETTGGTKVMKVSKILGQDQSGNFTLGISQIVPMNVFINLSDLTTETGTLQKSNRLLVENKKNISQVTLRNILKNSITPADIGLSVRKTGKNDGVEIISERIFIDQEIIDEVTSSIPSAGPVITYLANSIRKNEKATPYSFVAALPASIYSRISTGNNIVINRWLADDLDAAENDTVSMSWYAPSTNGKLEEKSDKFIISRIVEPDSIWADPSLMPEFPGIAGSSSCSEWDAGVPVNMKLIRKKDEAYWNSFKGTPKAFIGYEKGKELWGSNFGPATAIRFPESFSEYDIKNSLKGSFNPERTGFSISDVRSEAIKAAREGVDFGTLFLSLGFFIILSCIILLALSVSVFFDSRKDQVATFFSLGFTDKWIEKLLFLETSAIALTGSVPGVFAGGLINWLIIRALNSVWSGAVQTNTLGAHLAVFPMVSGFIITIIISLVLLRIKTRYFLKSLRKPETGLYTRHLKGRNFLFLVISLLISVLVIILSLIVKESSTSLFFAGGAATFITLILLIRQFFIGGFIKKKNLLKNKTALSRLFYSFYPSHAVTPVIFIAAGIFAVFITGVNRLNISDKMKEPSGGTGGFLLWCESAVPVKENLNIVTGRKNFGLDEENLKDLSFLQAKRSPGDDASCLNLNHVIAPPLLGLDPSIFVSKGSFSFASVMKGLKKENPWNLIAAPPIKNTVYGIADQTVLQWGLKISPGDTIILKSESGQPLNVIIAAGLKSSVFQGYVIIGADNFDKFYPSVPGSTVFLAAGNPGLIDSYQNVLKDRFANYGFSVMPASGRLASFFEVTNTYLSVFTILGAFGMLLGIAGLGFILLRNYNQRKREFALMIASGYSIRSLRRMVFREQIQLLFAGIFTGVLSALIATKPSIESGSEIPWLFLFLMILSVFLTGFIALVISVRAIKNNTLVASLRKE
jgi:ABC-type antimicrobial peptide transport system permease subunit